MLCEEFQASEAELQSTAFFEPSRELIKFGGRREGEGINSGWNSIEDRQMAGSRGRELGRTTQDDWTGGALSLAF